MRETKVPRQMQPEEIDRERRRIFGTAATAIAAASPA